MTWNELWPRYIENYSRVRHRQKTVDLYGLCCRTLSRFLGTLELERITDELVDSYIAFRKKEGVSNRTINIETSVLMRALKIAHRWKWVEDLPLSKPEPLSEGPLRVRFLDSEGRERLLDSAGKHTDIVLFFLSSGLRRNELKNLAWSDVDSAAHGVWVRDTKTKQPRFVPIADAGMNVIRKRNMVRRIDIPFVFFNPDTGKPWADLTHVVKKILRRAGLEDWRLHDLRHAFASHLHDKGAEMADLMQVLGHRSPQMTKRYVHISKSRISGLLARVSEDLKITEQKNFLKEA